MAGHRVNCIHSSDNTSTGKCAKQTLWWGYYHCKCDYHPIYKPCKLREEYARPQSPVGKEEVDRVKLAYIFELQGAYATRMSKLIRMEDEMLVDSLKEVDETLTAWERLKDKTQKCRELIDLRLELSLLSEELDRKYKEVK